MISRTAPIRVPRGVTRVTDCRLVRDNQPWMYAERAAADVATHWQRRQVENPAFFNGRILMTLEAEVADNVLVGRCTEVDFAEFLYWREQGYPDPVCDAFGSALIISADRKLMLARQQSGNINGGKVYPPGGFIDPRDVGPDGLVDVIGNVTREIAEETGLSPDDLDRQPGFLLSATGPQIAIGTVFHARQTAATLIERMDEGRAKDVERELAEILAVGSVAETVSLPLPDWTRALVAAVLG